jgi:LuxR family maltose regulon positive regulatory protein
MATSSQAALVEHNLLTQPDASEDGIPVGSPAWYAWLANATSFTFRSAHGTFTAHKEHRSPTQAYWKAYRRHQGRLHRVYLGTSHELSLDRLNAAASQLASDRSSLILSSGEPEDKAHFVVKETSDIPNEDAVPDALDRSRSLLPGNPIGDTAATIDDAQSLHLLATKLAIPPSRTSLVPRPHVLSRFDSVIAQRQRLLLVAAPAGFGKTTMIAEWLRSAGNCSVAWLALDDADNQLNLFLAYLIAALETVLPRIGAEAWTMLRGRAAQPPTQAILTSLINALAKHTDEIIVALDDYHTISLQAIHEAIAFLLEHMPAHMHIIITTRADPPLPLARLRARGQLAEVRAADLRFTRDEAIYLFEQIHHIALSPDAVTALEVRTEGWATGLQLAALSLHQQDATHISSFLAEFSGSHTYVFAYLAEEVFQKQPDHVRQFLVQTTILERLCAPLCAAVTGLDDAQATLEQVELANLFLMPLDTNRRWYRYHPLFRDFLRVHLERGAEAADRALLYRRASAWFEQQDLAGEAIDYALQAESWGDALRCLAPLTASERLYEYYLDWPRWIAALPDAALGGAPDLCLRLAWILTFIGHVEAAERPLAVAEAVWRTAGKQEKVGEVLCWRAVVLLFRSDFPRAQQFAQDALVALPAEAREARAISSLVLGSCYFEYGHILPAARPLLLAHETLQHSSDMFYAFAAAYSLAEVYRLQGHLRRAAALHQELIQRAASALHQSGPAVYIALGTILYEWNDLAAAEHTLREGIAIGLRTGRGRYRPRAYTVLAQVLWARGDIAQTHHTVGQALALSRSLGNLRIIAEVEAQQAWLWLVQGDQAAVERWLDLHRRDHADEPTVERLSEHLMCARIRIAQERQEPGSVDLAATVRLLHRLLQAAEDDERVSDCIAIRVLLALAGAAKRDPHQAFVPLTAALGLAEPEAYIRTFVDEGAPMQSLLIDQRTRLAARDVDKHLLAYVDRLLEAFPPDVRAAPSTPTKAQLLSEREQAVLRLLAAGLSIQEIAASLIISSHTARTHVKHIYAKLDVHNRVQALARARSLQLL